MSKYTIVEVNYGVSSVYSDGTIEINKKIKGKLRKDIIKHEKSHTFGKYLKKDFQVDFNAKNSHFTKVLFLSLINPEMLINYCIFMFSYNKRVWSFNQSAIFPFVYLGLIFSFVYSFALSLLRINFFSLFLGFFIIWIGLYCILNIVLIIYTHIYVKNH